MDGVFGLALGLLLIPFANTVFTPLWNAVAGGGKAAGQH
jgi:hypothetical protein